MNFRQLNRQTFALTVITTNHKAVWINFQTAFLIWF